VQEGCLFTSSTGLFLQTSPSVLNYEEQVLVVFLRDDLMRGIEKASDAAHAFTQAAITFRNICMQH
jgi:hypothetical protein